MEVGDFRVVVMLGNAAVLSKRSVMSSFSVVVCEGVANQYVKKMMIRVLRFHAYSAGTGKAGGRDPTGLRA